jgi:hypothetical protein
MTRLLFLMLFVGTLFSAPLYAQSFGVKAGLNLSNLVIKEDGSEIPDLDYRPGFHAGLTTDIPLSTLFSLDAGILASTKGAIIQQGDISGNVKFSFNMLYVDVPIALKAHFPINSTAKAYIAAGPYVGVGLIGKTKLTVTVLDESEETTDDITWGNNEEETNRLDYGASLGAGVELGSVLIGVSYNLGLDNIANTNEASIKHRVIGVSLGYRFGSGSTK